VALDEARRGRPARMTARLTPHKRSKRVQRVTTEGRPRTISDVKRSTEDQKGAAENF